MFITKTFLEVKSQYLHGWTEFHHENSVRIGDPRLCFKLDAVRQMHYRLTNLRTVCRKLYQPSSCEIVLFASIYLLFSIRNLWRDTRKVYFFQRNILHNSEYWFEPEWLSVKWLAMGWTAGIRFQEVAGMFLFATMCRAALGAHSAANLIWLPAVLSIDISQPEREADHSPLFKNVWSFRSQIRLHDAQRLQLYLPLLICSKTINWFRESLL